MNFRLARDQVVLLEISEPGGVKKTISSQFFLALSSCGRYNKTLPQPQCFPRSGNIEVLGETKPTVSLRTSHLVFNVGCIESQNGNYISKQLPILLI